MMKPLVGIKFSAGTIAECKGHVKFLFFGWELQVTLWHWSF